jgi:hypothetical protein
MSRGYEVQVIQAFGQGGLVTIIKRVDHHAEDIAMIAWALMNALLASEVARSNEVHELHLEKGANGANLYLDSGAKFAFRGRADPGGPYDRIEILDAPHNGKGVATVRTLDDVPVVMAVIEQAL